MRRGEASRWWNQKPETPACGLPTERDEQAELQDVHDDTGIEARPQPSSGCHVGNTGETRRRRGALQLIAWIYIYVITASLKEIRSGTRM